MLPSSSAMRGVAVSSDLESPIPAGDSMGWDGMADKLVVCLSQTAGDEDQ